MNKKQKRIIILNIPYAMAGLFATNFGEAWRIATGVNASEKIDHFIDALPVALSNPMPSFHPLDIAVGASIGGLLKLAVYLKGKNAKKYRHGAEYGTARWGKPQDIEPFVDSKFENNVILTQTERLTMNSRPKIPKYARNKNVLVIGGSGSGKTRFFLIPNILQMHAVYGTAASEDADNTGMKLWDNILSEMIFLLNEANEDTCTKENIYQKDYDKAQEEFENKYGVFGEKLMTEAEKAEEKKKGTSRIYLLGDVPEYKEISELYFSESRSLCDYRDECKNKALELFSKWFWDLWD